MRKLSVGSVLLLPACLFTLVATAQDPLDPQKPATCQSLSSASRTRSSQCGSAEESPEPLREEFTLTFELPVLETAQCKATLSIEYLQINANAEVSGVIENQDCAASGGEYSIEARLRDANGATSTVEFSETWERQDAEPVTFSAVYPIGENVELVRMRSRGLSCECAEPDSAKAPANSD